MGITPKPSGQIPREVFDRGAEGTSRSIQAEEAFIPVKKGQHSLSVMVTHLHSLDAGPVNVNVLSAVSYLKSHLVVIPLDVELANDVCSRDSFRARCENEFAGGGYLIE